MQFFIRQKEFLKSFTSQKYYKQMQTFNEQAKYQSCIDFFQKLPKTNDYDYKKCKEQYEYAQMMTGKVIYYQDKQDSKSLLWGNSNPYTSISNVLFLGLGVAFLSILIFQNSKKVLGRLDSRQHIKFNENSNYTFEDVLGIDECKQELQDLVLFLKEPERFHKVGAKLPKGVLLTGKPGTGKTLLAKAIAGEAQVKFLYSSGSEFEEMFVGLGAKRIRELFQAAKQAAPCIIFIDELDSLGGKRQQKQIVENRQSLNQLLVEMDGFLPTDNIIVIGATNMPEALDPALTRPGRFDKTVTLPLPDQQGRKNIIQYYLQKVKYLQEVDVDKICKKAIGMTGADIQNLVNLAVLNAVKNGRTHANDADFELALDRIQLGVDMSHRKISDYQKQATAIHEAGHIIASILTQGSSKLHKATILPRGQSLGATHFLPEENNPTNRQTILAQIDIAMGGRAAEEIILGKGNISTGCSADLQAATKTIYEALSSGMFQEQTGLVSRNIQDIGPQRRNLIDSEAKNILDNSYNRVKTLLQNNLNQLQKLSNALIEKETMTGEEITTLLKS